MRTLRVICKGLRMEAFHLRESGIVWYVRDVREVGPAVIWQEWQGATY